MGAICFVIYDIKNPPKNINFNDFIKSKHRGPDSSTYVSESTQNLSHVDKNLITYTLSKREILEYKQFIFISGYHRLSINDLSVSGNQPFENPIMHKVYEYPELRSKPKRTLLCNGEIYNYNSLKETEKFTDKDLGSNCDVEILLPMYDKHGLEETLKKVDGDYSFILTENLNTYQLKNINIYAVRDIFGTKPLYMIKNSKISFYMFVTELKSIPVQLLLDKDYIVKEVPPGTYWSFNNSIIKKSNNDFIRYSDWNFYKDINNCKLISTDPDTLSSIYSKIRELLTNSVIKRYNLSNKPVGLLVSGGFDSSIILSILIKYLKSINHNFVDYPIHTFTLSDNNSELQSTLKNIEYLEKKHDINIKQHIISIQSIKENYFDILNNLVFQIETYDIDSLKKSVPFLYLFDYIKKSTNIKILLNGEGLDELCGYNKLFKKSENYYQEKSVKLIKYLSKFNLARIDKLAGYYGLEVRYPFLDREFVEYILQIHPKLKSPQIYNYSRKTIEKYLIRKAFDVEIDEIKYLNQETLWKPLQCPTKSVKLFNSSEYLKSIDNIYSDAYFNNYLLNLKNSNIPKSKEEMHFQIVYNKHFPETLDLLPTYYYNLF